MASLSRIAIVDHVSAGGVSRFLFALIAHLAGQLPETRVSYFVSEANVERDGLATAFAAYPNVEVVPIRAAIPLSAGVEVPQKDRGWAWNTSVALLRQAPGLHRVLRDAYVGARDIVSPPPPPWHRYRLDVDVVERLRSFDLAYIGWPYFLEPFDPGIPLVATFHDFHFRLFPEAYQADALRILERQTPRWLQQCAAITSTRFIRDQMLTFFPDAAREADVVYLAPYGFAAPDEGTVESTLQRLGVRRPYVLYSGGRSAHKNIASLARGAGLLKDRGTPVQLVITGHGTELIGAGADVPPSDSVHRIDEAIVEAGLVRGEGYLALGYVSNADVDALTVGADAVVSASLYEAGCGPAMDAWQAGVPVAFSNIPPFLEQIERFGVEAWAFDPLDPADIADKVGSAVFDTEASHAMARRSRAAFAAYTWDDVAAGYRAVFERAARKGR